MDSFERERRPPDRRKQADWVVKAAATLSVIAWLVAIVVTFVLDFASPERVDFFTHQWGGDVRTYWNDGLLPVAFVLLILSFLCCIAAFIFNMLRMRRKTDKYRKSVIIMGVVSFGAIVFFLVRFGGILFG